MPLPPLQNNIWDTVTNPGVLVSAGANTGSLSAVTFSNSNGVSFGLNAGTITASIVTAAGGAALQGSGTFTQNTGTIQFANSNGVSFGLTAGQMTATVETDYAGQGFTSSTTAGTEVVGTLSTNGISLGVPAYITTYSNDLTSGRAGTGFTSATTAGTNVVGTLDTNGLSVGVPEYITTYANDLTSGRAGTGFTSTTTAGTAVVGTLNTSGLSLGVPAYLTTYVNDLTSGRAGTGFTSTTTAGTAIVATLNTSGLSMGVPAYLTTAPSTAGLLSAVNFSAGTTSQNLSNVKFANSNHVTFGVGTGANSSVITAAASLELVVGTVDVLVSAFEFRNSNGVSWGFDTGNLQVTATVATNYAGQGFTTTTTSGTAVVGTLSTNGLSMGIPAYVTAASGGGGVAISNSQTLFTSGTVALSEGGGAITIASSAGGQSLMFSVPQTSSLAGASGISISTSGSTISIYQSGINGVGVSNTGNTAGNVGYLTNSNYALAGSGSITLSQSTAAGAATCYIQHPAWITTGAVSSAHMSYFENMPTLDEASTTVSASGSVLQVIPFVLPRNISIGWIRFPVSMSYVSTEASGTTANSTWTVNRSYTDAVAIYTQLGGASSLSLGYLTSSSATWVFQNQIQAGANGSRYTVTQNVSYPISNTTSNYTTSYPQSSANVQISSASMTLFTGPRWLDVPFALSLSAGNYWMAVGRSTNSATQAGNAALGAASMGMSYIAVSQQNQSVALMGAVTNSSNQLQPGLGSWSTNAAVMSTSSLQLASISAMSSGPKIYFQMIRFA